MVSKFANPPDKIAVLCVAKTGGTSLSNILHTEFGPRYCLREIQHLQYDVLGHVNRDQLEAYLRRMPHSRFDEIRLIVGHIPVGLGIALPRAKFHYVTLLRDPISRLVSSYFYINQQCLLRRDKDYLNAMLHRTISIGGDPVYSNPLTRLLTGSEALIPRKYGEAGAPLIDVTQSDLDLALQNLRGFAFVGLTERFSDSVRMLFAKLGRTFDRNAPKENATNTTLRVNDIHPDTIALLQRSVGLDQRLYGEAVHMFGRHALEANLPTFDYQEPALSGPQVISSGDHSHLASAASAMSDRLDGIWISADTKHGSDEWIGVEFDHEFACEELYIQIPPIDGDNTAIFQLEASNDEFRHDACCIAGFGVACDGQPHRIVVGNRFLARSWRIRCINKPSDDPLMIAYLNLNPREEGSPRSMDGVVKRTKLARSILE